MSNPQYQQQGQQSEKRPPVPESITVRSLRFDRATDVIGNEGISSLKSGGQDNERRWEIAFVPWMRHFRITCHEPVAKKLPARIAYVHESVVRSWEAM